MEPTLRSIRPNLLNAPKNGRGKMVYYRMHHRIRKGKRWKKEDGTLELNIIKGLNLKIATQIKNLCKAEMEKG